MFYDYLIAGSGPAGATAAYCLSMNGAKCLMLEAQKFRKEKICGGLLTWSGIELLNKINLDVSELLPLGSKIIRHFVLVRNGVKKVHSYKNNEFALGMQRIQFDSWLVEHALRCGAEIQYSSRVRDYNICGEVFEINGYRCRNLVFACGARGFVFPSQWTKVKQQSFGISAQIVGSTTLKDDSVYFWYIDNSNDYFWAIPIGEKRWNIGIWFEKPVFPLSKSVFTAYQKKYIETVFEQYSYAFLPRGTFCGNVNLAENLPDRCFGLGDFAGKNRSFSGEGLRYAIESAFDFYSSGSEK